MTWKKSKDGGIDYEVEELIERHERESQPKEFNPFATAHTMTFNMNYHELEIPRKKTIQERMAEIKRNRRHGY